MSDPSADVSARREEVLLQRTTSELMRKFAGRLPEDVIENCVLEAYESVARGAKVRMYLVATAGRLARDRLAALARDAEARRTASTDGVLADSSFEPVGSTSEPALAGPAAED
jgi:hypothetical protein